MKTLITLSVVTALIVYLAGCTMGPTTPVGYALIADITTPAIEAVASPDGTIGSRRGEASVYNLAFVTSFGDSSIAAAARNGGITEVKTVAYAHKNVFYVFQRGTTIVTGD